jgi:hypothetical protein
MEHLRQRLNPKNNRKSVDHQGEKSNPYWQFADDFQETEMTLWNL